MIPFAGRPLPGERRLKFPVPGEESILFVTLDSCRYDSFAAAMAPNMKGIGPLNRAMAPGNFTFGSHASMFVGFTPGVANSTESFVNPKYGKIFKMVGTGFPGRGTEFMTLAGGNIVQGLRREGYRAWGTGAVGWFDPRTDAGQQLTRDFDEFYYPGNTYSLPAQLKWIAEKLEHTVSPAFVFLNVGETHVPYYYEGAPWDRSYNPCVPFSTTNDTRECRRRQVACIEYVDRLLAPLLEAFAAGSVILCADHGDCWGEDGLWEHGIHHQKVLEVPLVLRLARTHRP
jgi:sulfatase-like protein